MCLYGFIILMNLFDCKRAHFRLNNVHKYGIKQHSCLIIVDMKISLVVCNNECGQLKCEYRGYGNTLGYISYICNLCILNNIVVYILWSTMLPASLDGSRIL